MIKIWARKEEFKDKAEALGYDLSQATEPAKVRI